MTGESRALHEAKVREDDVDVSEFFGGESLDEMFVTLTEDEVETLTE